MARSAAILAVHLVNHGQRTRVGSLVRDGAGAVAFVVDDLYLRDPQRPTLSLRWTDVRNDAEAQARLANRYDKIAYPGFLPPWFSGLLPEGALRDLVEREMGPGDHDYFDVLARLGADLPGAVIVTPETGPEAMTVDWSEASGAPAPLAEGVVKFSLAGVQLKFNMAADGERLTMPGRGEEGHIILKAPARAWPNLPETEHAAMALCKAIGVDTAPTRLVATSDVEGLPQSFIHDGDQVLAVDRFDRTPTGRIHIEDMAQILGAVGDRKYTMGNTETVLNIIRRFSADPRADVLEGLRRVAADILIGNGDNHLKNWSFRFPDGVRARLSPAYDIVPTVLYHPGDKLALPFVGSRIFETIGLHKFRRAAEYLKIRPDVAEAEIRRTVQAALDLWPELIRTLPLTDDRADCLLARLDTLKLVADVRNPNPAALRRRKGAPGI